MFHGQFHRCILVLGPQLSICVSPIQRESDSLKINTCLLQAGAKRPIVSNPKGGKSTVTKVRTASTHPTGPPVIQPVCSLFFSSSLSFVLGHQVSLGSCSSVDTETKRTFWQRHLARWSIIIHLRKRSLGPLSLSALLNSEKFWQRRNPSEAVHAFFVESITVIELEHLVHFKKITDTDILDLWLL